MDSKDYSLSILHLCVAVLCLQQGAPTTGYVALGVAAAYPVIYIIRELFRK